MSDISADLISLAKKWRGEAAKERCDKTIETDLATLAELCDETIESAEEYAAKFDVMAKVVNGVYAGIGSVGGDTFNAVYQSAVHRGCNLIGHHVADDLLPELPTYTGSVGSNRTATALTKRLKVLRSLCSSEETGNADATGTSQTLSFEPGLFFYRGQEFKLPGKPLDVLRAFADAHRCIRTVEQLRSLWGELGSSDVGDEAIKQHVSTARRALRGAIKRVDGRRGNFNPIPHLDRGVSKLAWRLKLTDQ